MTAAPLAERIVEKGLASDGVVINTVVAKYCDHLPLYRQAVMMERAAGVEIGRATQELAACGRRAGGPKVAAILSVVESCRRLGVPVKKYLAAVLPGLNRRTLPEVSSLTPARWLAGRG